MLLFSTMVCVIMERPIVIFAVMCIMCVSEAWSVTTNDETIVLKDIVMTLKGQLGALLERRQEDYTLIENSLRKSLEKSIEMSTLRTELNDLRKEVDIMSGNKGSNQKKNDHLTVQWLSTAVGELRNELTEVAAAYNVSVELQQRQETLTGLGLLRKDLAGFRKEFEEIQAEQERSSAKITQMQQEIATTRAQSQSTASMCTDLAAQLKTAQTEWTISLRAMKKASKFQKKMSHSFQATEETLHGDNDAFFAKHLKSEDRKYRHNRDIQVQMQEIGVTEQQLHSSQLHLDHKLRRIEKQMKNLLYHGVNHNDGFEELRNRVVKLESAGTTTVKAMFNASRQMAGMDKIHQSMLELLESVESVENKVDKNVPDLQREIAKLEFNMAQMTSTVSLIKEEQENQVASTKAVFNGIVALEEKISTNRDHVSVIQAQLLNLTTEKTNHSSSDTNLHRIVEDHGNTRLNSINYQKSPRQSPTSTAILDQGNGEKHESNSVSRLVQELSQVQNDYNDIIHRLPHDCSAVSGPSGLYLISPGGKGAPLMTYCDQTSGEGGWTMVQRRFDGAQEFNHKWDEYANGFGSPSGEFWLGNENLHRLTSDNCSSLRVDLKDIYGKTWYAEYAEFSVASSEDGYRLHVTSYSGNASDALEYQNRMQFSTIDSDRDISNTNCASNYEGGWWFSHCQHANLNGKYTLGLTWFDSIRNEWIAVAKSEMKVKHKTDCKRT